MQVITTIAEMQSIAESAKQSGQTVGCVPTMGSLHNGHGSLIAASAERHAVTVTSVFVNPTQFGPNEDYDSYPRDLEGDIEKILEHGGTHVFAPSVAEMYPEGFTTSIRVGGVTEVLEGARRPGHFDGVATVVCKLLEAMRPNEAFFGQERLSANTGGETHGAGPLPTRQDLGAANDAGRRRSGNELAECLPVR